MIQLYTWGTPNGKKVSIMLEEVGLPYEVHPINLQKGDQFTPEYLAVNPNNKIPSIIDRDGPGGQPMKLFESGAILMYLAEKTGKLWPQELRKRYEVMQWLMFQMGGVGPMFGQANFFFRLSEKVPYAIERYHKEALAALQSFGPAARKDGIPRRRVYDRRYCHVPVGLAARNASSEVRGVS